MRETACSYQVAISRASASPIFCGLIAHSPSSPMRSVHRQGITIGAQSTYDGLYSWKNLPGIVNVRRLYVTLIDILGTTARRYIRSTILRSIGQHLQCRKLVVQCNKRPHVSMHSTALPCLMALIRHKMVSRGQVTQYLLASRA